MIHVNVTGTKDKKILTEACYFFLWKLNIYKKTIPLDINVKLCLLGEDGHCEFNDDFRYPEITISINKEIEPENILITMAHELVHARQFLRRQLTSKCKQQFWKGNHSEDEEWEIEAYELEQKLYSEYIKWK